MSLAIHPSMPTTTTAPAGGAGPRRGLPAPKRPAPEAPERPTQGADDAKAGSGFLDGGWGKAASAGSSASTPSPSRPDASKESGKASPDDGPKPQTQFEAKAQSMDGSSTSTIPYQVDKDVREDAPIPDIESVQYAGAPISADPLSVKVTSQVIAKGADGTVASTEVDSDNTFVDMTQPEVENEVEIDGWKYTFQVEFDDNEASKVRLIDAQPA
jgi:hypothetical protein